MNFSIGPLVMFGVGAVLVYASIKNLDPRDVVKRALGGNPRVTVPDGTEIREAASKPAPRIYSPAPYITPAPNETRSA